MMKRWQMRRNCALSPRQLFQFYVLLICLSLIVGMGFLIAGIWIILIFTLIEVIAVTTGFLVYSRHALDCETIEIEGRRLLVKKFIGHKETLYEFNTQWVKIEMPAIGSKTFHLVESGFRMELGQFLRHDQQLTLIKEVRLYLG